MFSNSNRYKLQANSFAPGTLSHQLYVYCSINGKPSGAAQIRKTVNFYRFKEFVEKDLRVVNFSNWYFDNKLSIVFLNALSQFINKSEKREAYYFTPSASDTMLNRLLNEVQQTNKSLADLLLAM